MKKIILLKFVLLIGIVGNSQTIDFTLANPQPNLLDIYADTFASGDIDVDGDKDLFMTRKIPFRFIK